MNQIDDKEKKKTLKYICNKVICLDGVKFDKIEDNGVRIENNKKDSITAKIITITINKKTSTALNHFVVSLQLKACLRVNSIIFSPKLYGPDHSIKIDLIICRLVDCVTVY
uniref:Uncharacterized protein n=1 Tax=Glossina pallidipes TaxID=7398 RepID=A0A1A9Z1R8_GLOPL